MELVIEQVVTDPSAPGFETLVVPTPSHMIFGVDGDGRLTMVAVIGLSSNDEGGIVLLLAGVFGIVGLRLGQRKSQARGQARS